MGYSTEGSLKTCKHVWSRLNRLQHFETWTSFQESLHRPSEANVSFEKACPAGGREHGFVDQWPGRPRVSRRPMP